MIRQSRRDTGSFICPIFRPHRAEPGAKRPHEGVHDEGGPGKRARIHCQCSGSGASRLPRVPPSVSTREGQLMAHHVNPGNNGGNASSLGSEIHDVLRCPHRLIRMPEPSEITTLSCQTIYREIDSGRVPAGILDGSCRLWHTRAINSFLWMRCEESWTRRRPTDEPAFKPWSPKMERDDIPHVRLVRRRDALDTVGLPRSACYSRCLGPGVWSKEAALREIASRRLRYVPTPPPIQLTLMRGAFLLDELDRFVELRAELLGPDGMDFEAVAQRLEAASSGDEVPVHQAGRPETTGSRPGAFVAAPLDPMMAVGPPCVPEIQGQRRVDRKPGPGVTGPETLSQTIRSCLAWS